MDPLNAYSGQFLPNPTQNDEAISNLPGSGTLNSLTGDAKPLGEIKDQLGASTLPVDVKGNQVTDSATPNPPGSLKRASSAVAKFIATGGMQGSGGAGNPYFAPNMLAVLSEHMYKFYSAMRTSELGMAQVVNKGMAQSADLAKSTAAAQISIGEAERNKAIGQAVMGGLTAAGGAFSLIMVTSALFKGMRKTSGIKTAKSEANAAKTKLDDVSGPDSNVAAKQKTFSAKTDALKEARATRDDAKNLKSGEVSTDPTKPANKDVDIKAANKDVRAKRAEVKEAEKEYDIAVNEQKAISKEYYQKQKTYQKMESKQYEELNNASLVSNAFTSVASGLGQVITGVNNSFQEMTIAQQNALVTLLQTQMQNVNKSSDSASQAAQGTKDNMNSLLSALDNTVQKTNEANRAI